MSNFNYQFCSQLTDNIAIKLSISKHIILHFNVQTFDLLYFDYNIIFLNTVKYVLANHVVRIQRGNKILNS